VSGYAYQGHVFYAQNIDRLSPLFAPFTGESVRSRPELVSFKLDRILDAYDTFGDATKSRALKVIIEV
jgi:hypothetical protein